MSEKEDLLRALAQLEEAAVSDPSDLSDPSDETLAAYRQGRLDEAEARAVEAALAADPAARARLLALAGVEAPSPSPAVRRAVLDAVTPAPGPQPQPRPRVWWSAAAVAASLFLAIGYCFAPRVPEMPPSTMASSTSMALELAFAVEARGLRAERGADDVAAAAGGEDVTSVAGYPDTEVEIEVTPLGAARADVAFALYAERGGTLLRLGAEAGVTVDTARGAAVIRIDRPGALVDEVPGRSRLLVVAARAGDLPPRLAAADAGDDPQTALAAGGRRWVHPLWLTVEAVEPI